MWDFGTIRNVHARPGTFKKSSGPTISARTLPFPPPPTISPPVKNQSPPITGVISRDYAVPPSGPRPNNSILPPRLPNPIDDFETVRVPPPPTLPRSTTSKSLMDSIYKTSTRMEPLGSSTNLHQERDPSYEYYEEQEKEKATLRASSMNNQEIGSDEEESRVSADSVDGTILDTVLLPVLDSVRFSFSLVVTGANVIGCRFIID